MVENKNILKEKVFYWLLTFVAITIPFPSYSISSQAIISFAIFWIFFNSFKEKKTLFKKNSTLFFIASIPFWLTLIGIFFTNDPDIALKEIINKLPFLILPLILFTVSLQNKTTSFITKQFSYGVFIASLLALSKVVYFKINGLGDYFYYDKLSLLLNKHTTYFALFIVLSILIVVYQLIRKLIPNYITVVLLLIFIPLLYMLSVRISVLALFFGLIVIAAYNLKIKHTIGIIALLTITCGALYFTPNFQKRFEKSTIDNSKISDIDFRKLHWKAIIETLENNSLLIGNGTGSNRDYLINKYRNYKLTAAYEDEYNAHNQFLEILLNHGFIGFTIFLIMLFYITNHFIKNKDSLAISCLAVFFIFMLTESILERHSGVIVFALLITLLLNKKKLIEKHIKHNNSSFYLCDLNFKMQKPSQIHILNTSIHNLSMEETLSLVNNTIKNKESIHHVVVNAGKIVQMQKDNQLRESVNNSDIINADGQAVVWAANFLNKPLKERVAGIDLMENLVELAYKNNHKIYLFGAKEKVIKKVVSIYTNKYGKNLIAGYRNGYYGKDDEATIAKDIASSGANMLFVAITSPKKENFLYQFKNELKSVNFIMGVGGSFDVISGLTKRAPLWMQNNGLEWFYRFIQEPKRMWKRYLVGNSKFIYLVFKEKIRGSSL